MARAQLLERYESLALPTTREEHWRFTDLAGFDPGAFTADFAVVRALLHRGRPYDAAVQKFEPYERIQEPVESARTGMSMIAEKAFVSKKSAFVFVNNRLEGNAPSTIEEVVELLRPRLFPEMP